MRSAPPQPGSPAAPTSRGPAAGCRSLRTCSAQPERREDAGGSTGSVCVNHANHLFGLDRFAAAASLPACCCDAWCGDKLTRLVTPKLCNSDCWQHLPSCQGGTKQFAHLCSSVPACASHRMVRPS